MINETVCTKVAAWHWKSIELTVFFYSSATVLRGKLSILPFISVCSLTKVIGYDKNIPIKNTSGIVQ